ncbi:DUF3515 domain-containing protein [Rhodococcus sp. X156]|uniref:DUF3515 domain-containing protein n=1 Tax=Rhodococcus sp. X156 TaxID=2499145 RepID=UPI000FD957F3|nr:DUF3515 domain-containing protein [Rhodococcus sp. X156]
MSRTHPPAVLAAAVALPVALAVGVIAAAVIAKDDSAGDGPVVVGAIPAPEATSPECTSLLAALPQTLGDDERAQLVQPAPAGAAAWQGPESADPVVLRCGIDRPAEFDTAAALVEVDGVQWLQISGAEVGLSSTTWVAVDRAVYVGLTLPNGTGPTPVQEISSTVRATLPATALDPAPVR